MRILHTVELYEPSVGGAQEVVRQISTRLATHGHSVTVATSSLPERTSNVIDGVQVAEFAISGNAVRGYEGDIGAYRDFVIDGEFDVVMNYAAQQWATDALLPALDRIRYARTLAPCGFSGLHDPSYSEYFRELPLHLANYDALIFHSDMYRDIEFARAAGLKELTVIPNGADEGEFGDASAGKDAGREFRRRYRIPDTVPLLLTVGAHTGEKGHALAIEALRRTKLPRATLVIAANMPLGRGCLWGCRRRAARAMMMSRGRKRVLMPSLSRDEVLAAFHAADLFVFGSMIECSPIVLFEAMAAGTPFVTTAVGNAEEIATWGGGGRVVPTEQLSNGRVTASPDDMAVAIDELLADLELRRAIGQSGRRAWEREFTWGAVAARYERLYEQVVTAKAGRDTANLAPRHLPR